MKLVVDTNILISGSLWEGPPARLVSADDVHVLSCAVGAEADAIVTGDKDLLTLKVFEGIPIIDATEALKRLGLS